MKKIKIAGLVFLLSGIALFLVSLLADYIGLGDVDPDHFIIGSKQIAGMALGTASFIVGIFLWLKKS